MNLKEVLDSQQFYEMMQVYRHTPIFNQKGVTEAFEAVKNFILDNAEKTNG